MAPQVRSAMSSDAAAIAAIYAPIVRETSISFELEPPDTAEIAARIERVQGTHPWLVQERDGQIEGYAYATEFRARAAYGATAETTVYVAPEARRRGVARSLMTALLEELTEREMHLAVAGVTLPNEASVALHEALGFRHVGTFDEVGRKFNRWWSVGFWQLELELSLRDTVEK